MPPLDVLVSTPFPLDSQLGNTVSALRIAHRINSIGLRTVTAQEFTGQDAGALIALHARRSLPTVDAFREKYPGRPVITVITGSDLYQDLPRGDTEVLRGMEIADRLVLYQDASAQDVPEQFRDKLSVIWKSVDLDPHDSNASPPVDHFACAILAHLRPIKDPFLPVEALSGLPETTRIKINHFGEAIDEDLAAEAKEWMRKEPRYSWHGHISREDVPETICTSHLTINSGLAEGGSNSVCESIVFGVPVLASDTPANVGFLGAEYSGYFPTRDRERFRELLVECSDESTGLLRKLSGQVADRAHLFLPETESAGWATLLQKVGVYGNNQSSRINRSI